MSKVYRSKIGVLFGLIFGVPFGVGVYVIWSAITKGDQSPNALIFWSFVGIVLPTSMILGTWYRITKETLYVRSLWVRARVPIREITTIEETQSLWSSPALSFDRLIISYGGKSVIISPTRKSEFIADIRGLQGRA